jgi:OTU domain-containing protein 6
MEITALARALRVRVEIYSNRSLMPLVVNMESDNTDDNRIIRLSYYQHLYGLGQHYNALFPVSKKSL